MTQKTVLVVDDQRFVRQVVGTALTGAGGYRVLEAGDGTEAIRLIESGGPSLDPPAAGTDLMVKPPRVTIDCIISDINMLPMNGLEFLKAIRLGLTPIERDMPVLMLTGHAEKHFLATAIALDACGFIVKPVGATMLRERTERAIAGRHAVKPASDYAALIVPDIEARDLWSSSAALKRPAAAVRATDLTGGPYRAETLPTAELMIGDRFAEDLLTEDDVLVVPNGTRVTASLLPAIRDLADIVKLKPLVMVFRG
jgi:CheY-like chemotaxis protein